MIIPVRCMTCGKVLADKWLYYNRRVNDKKDKGEIRDDDVKQDVVNVDGKHPRGEILDELELKRPCCRRHMLGHTDLIDVIGTGA